MLFILRSSALFSASISTSPPLGPVAAVPPPAALVEPVVADPVVLDDPPAPPDPEELAVPKLLVPSGGGEATFDELPAPLGSLPELLRPPTLAGPEGTPLTPWVPAPAEPALGDPAAVPLPTEGPLAAPPALAPVAPPPVPPPAPLEVCANEAAENINRAVAATAVVIDRLAIGNSLS